LEPVFLSNLTSPPLLFFILGALATLLRTDLEIPEAVAKLLSVYLLMAIGFKGGVALSENAFSWDAYTGLFIALFLSALVPILVFFVLRRSQSVENAAAMAATYGSISAVTFVTCTSYLDVNEIDWSGYLVAAMALMESPAIIIGLLLCRIFSEGEDKRLPIKGLLREAFLNGSVFLILGSLCVGYISGAAGKAQIDVFVNDLFVGVLCLFLLDMGIVAMRRLSDLGSDRAAVKPMQLLAWGIAIPIVNAALAIGLCLLFEISLGDAILITVLSASASYIAVPAALRLALPQANPSLYLTASLGVTFPFNLLVGIPLYHRVLEAMS
jgi:hypothetical protein